MPHHDQPAIANSIHAILEEFRQIAPSEREKGNLFEKLIVAYLKGDPMQQARFGGVWLWRDWVKEHGKEFGHTGQDTGVDLVAQEADGGWCAIQCKFYAADHKLDLPELGTFFTLLGKKPFTTGLVVSTCDHWSAHAEEALDGQTKPVTRLRAQELENSPVDWAQFNPAKPQEVKLKAKKRLRKHQTEALEKVLAGFQAHDRGKLIMACGTGKTFTALKLAEKVAPQGGGRVLFLAPSISLVNQTLREWTAEAEAKLHAFAVCSDSKVGKRESDDIRAHDLAYPATTDAKKLAAQFKKHDGAKKLTVVFSTYQSIEVIHEAQAKHGLPGFDLIICDEAHRTTGAKAANEDESEFVRVHDAKYIQAAKRLYMTATPRIFTEATKSKADENDVAVYSMDDPILYGPEFHRLGFAQALSDGILVDYKVLVLAVDEGYVGKAFQQQISNKDDELSLDDAAKILGCWNGLAKRVPKEDRAMMKSDPAPMRRAVAFSGSIEKSERLARLFKDTVDKYRDGSDHGDRMLACEVAHVDGQMNALERCGKLDWLKVETPGKTCRILSNARCLTEGVDIPALDAVMFLNPRNSVVDVVQAVGRVMRKAEGKKYGYIILPIAVPAHKRPEDALNDNDKYRVVWQVLQALRAHDDRFNAMVNKIELNNARPENLQLIGVGGDPERDDEDGKVKKPKAEPMGWLFPQLEEWRDAIYAKVVKKCGDRRYWEDWAKDVAEIAQRHVSRIQALLKGGGKERVAFDAFLENLRQNLNPAVSEMDAIEMLAQHVITKPVFDALFEGYAFSQHNPVSQAMQGMLDILEGQALEKDAQVLEKFYVSVRDRAKGVDNAEGKQKIIIELYDKFFKTAFPRMAERLGIVYTPVEVVDFILKSADQALRREFGMGLSDKGVTILDPFAGTGTFTVRMIQSDLIKPEDLGRKYTKELFTNEIVLLAYYIAAINIEAAYHGKKSGKYRPFKGISLTDTFQMAEGDMPIGFQLEKNSKRARRQKRQEITVILGNPPYSMGQASANDNNQNLEYPHLDASIENTYAERSVANNKKSLYDSYIRAIRWASDRIAAQGVICFVSSGGWLDSSSADGLRACLADEFTSIYCFNLRGNQRTAGELSRKEGGKIFGSGSRTPIAITLLVKNPKRGATRGVFYHDIGDYLTRDQKLKIIADFGGMERIPWQTITPNDAYDWINQRSGDFDSFLPLGDKESDGSKAVFGEYSMGVVSARDAWVYNFSKKAVSSNMSRTIQFYNEQVMEAKSRGITKDEVSDFVDNNAKKISWSRALKGLLGRGKTHEFDESCIVSGMYRPYTKQCMYFNRQFNEMVLKVPGLFPTSGHNNCVISVPGIGASKEFSALITNLPPDLNLQAGGAQCFPLYHYEKPEEKSALFAGNGATDAYTRHNAIPESTVTLFREKYADKKIEHEDIFYFVYGILHSPEYKTRFANDLKKMLPRLPWLVSAADFWSFSKAGRELAEWHLNYETVDPYPVVQSATPPKADIAAWRIEEMKFAKGKAGGRDKDKTVIHCNGRITISGIPLEAYDYIVNGKSVIEWVMERYGVSTHRDSGIVNDVNRYALETAQDPAYIVDLLKRVIRVSVETVRIVKALPALEIRE